MVKENGLKNIFVADDHHLILEGIYSILKQIPFVGNITAFSSGKLAKEAMLKKKYDAYILDLEFPDVDGFELIQNLLEAHPEAPIIVVTMHEEAWYVNRLIQIGVQSIVLKSSSHDHLQNALEAVIKGEIYFCPRFDYLKKKQDTSYSRTPHTMPTKRELEVLQYISQGYTTNEIAEKLFISSNTAETFRKSLMLKLEAKNMAHLVSIAIERKLICPDKI